MKKHGRKLTAYEMLLIMMAQEAMEINEQLDQLEANDPFWKPIDPNWEVKCKFSTKEIKGLTK